MEPNALLTKTVSHSVLAALRPLRFVKRGLIFTRTVHDVSHLVQIQKSMSSTKECIRFTINLGVWAAILDIRANATVGIGDAQWRVRIGETLPAPHDLWWSAGTLEEAMAASTSVTDHLLRFGIPALDALSSTDDLKRYWQSGGYGGIGDIQRDRYLKMLQ